MAKPRCRARLAGGDQLALGLALQTDRLAGHGPDGAADGGVQARVVTEDVLSGVRVADSDGGVHPLSPPVVSNSIRRASAPSLQTSSSADLMASRSGRSSACEARGRRPARRPVQAVVVVTSGIHVVVAGGHAGVVADGVVAAVEQVAVPSVDSCCHRSWKALGSSGSGPAGACWTAARREHAATGQTGRSRRPGGWRRRVATSTRFAWSTIEFTRAQRRDGLLQEPAAVVAAGDRHDGVGRRVDLQTSSRRRTSVGPDRL